MQDGGEVTAAMLPSRPVPATASPLLAPLSMHLSNMPPASPDPDPGCEPLWLTEKKAIERAITLCRGNIVAAAKRLEINPSTIYRKKAGWESVSKRDAIL